MPTATTASARTVKPAPEFKPLDTLETALGARLGLRAAGTVKALIEAAAPGAWLRLAPGRRLRFSGHLDLQPDLLVHVAPPQGVLGLVYLLPADESRFLAAARQAVDDAVQLRQLLLETAESINQSASPPKLMQRALQVELVLLVPPDTEAGAHDRLAEAFNDYARRTRYLRLIGLNLLPLSQGGTLDEAALRRAFCWLLHHTRAWFQSLAGSPAAPAAWQLKLQDYRLSGKRQFTPTVSGTGRLHLVHGHNGAGKSSLVEAIELLMTQKIERLNRGGATPYFETLRHRPRSLTARPADEVHAELRLGDTRLSHCRIDSHGPVFTPAAGLGVQRALSFRIDQAFMNDLVRADPGARAVLFMEAFAPSDNALLAAVREQQENFERAWANLPADLKPPGAEEADPPPLPLSVRFSWIHQRLVPLASPGSTVPQGGWAALLPLRATELATLAPRWPGLATPLAALEKALPTAAFGLLAKIDEELAALREALPGLLEDLRTALRVMGEFLDWQAAGQVRRGASVEQDLQRWLELMALVDLAGKYGDVVQTLARAAEQGWLPDTADLKALPPLPVPPDAARWVRLRGAELQQELNDARERLRAWQAKGSGAAAKASRAKPGGGTHRRHLLTAAEQAALDRAGAWLPAAAAVLPLGQSFDRALASNTAVTLAAGTIGAVEGLAQPIVEARLLIPVIEAILARHKTAWPKSSTALGLVKAAVDAAVALNAANQALSGSFFQSLVDTPAGKHLLLPAVNELLALATPARWAYSDVGLQSRIHDGRAELGLEAQGGRADLMLNTAELTAFTLVLFLLLAPRVDNPLRLLVLDDPLQNMDEMMVCTLGRALARLLAVFPPGWAILAFFHGVDDMERIREEAPAEVYHLPWARPLPEVGAPASAVVAMPELGTALRPCQALNAELLTLVRS